VKERCALFDVRAQRDEVFRDERRDVTVVVRFGFQPNAPRSIGGGGKIREDRPRARGPRHRGIDLGLPIDRHATSSSAWPSTIEDVLATQFQV
jgi:hypothetical protein